MSVLVDAADPTAVHKAVEKWKGTSKAVTPLTLMLRVPRSALRDLASLDAVKYIEASVKLKPHCDQAHLSTGLIRAGVRSVS